MSGPISSPKISTHLLMSSALLLPESRKSPAQIQCIHLIKISQLYLYIYKIFISAADVLNSASSCREPQHLSQKSAATFYVHKISISASMFSAEGTRDLEVAKSNPIFVFKFSQITSMCTKLPTHPSMSSAPFLSLRSRHHNLYIQNHAAHSHVYKTFISTTYVLFSAPDTTKMTKSTQFLYSKSCISLPCAQNL